MSKDSYNWDVNKFIVPEVVSDTLILYYIQNKGSKPSSKPSLKELAKTYGIKQLELDDLFNN